MKRKGNLYDQICSIDNLILAESKARRGKKKQYGVKKFSKSKDDLLINLHHTLLNKEYKTSNYKIFRIIEKKERIIYQLPYYPDRIVHHAIMNILEEIFVKCFIVNTYSCIKKRGIHKCLSDLNKALIDVENTQYCLKLDIKKFYPSIKNSILKQLLRKKFKDSDLLNLLDEVIGSNFNGLPIGNYLSQFLANFYLTYFDHFLKETLGIKDYFRYCDDMVILGKTKEELRIIKDEIIKYLDINLDLELSNWQIFPIWSRGIDFVGYKSYHKYIFLRKSIKLDFIRMIKYRNNSHSISSYNGWLLYCNSINLRNKYLK